MSEKKKIKINVDDEETAKKENTEKTAPANDDETDEAGAPTADDDRVDDNDPIKALEARIASKEDEAKETHERLLRVSADFENYKKR